MYKFITCILGITILFSGCSSENRVRIVSELENADIIVNDKKVGQIRIGYSTILLPSGEHKIAVEKVTNDGEWLFKAEQTIYVSSNKLDIIDFPKALKYYRKKD